MERVVGLVSSTGQSQDDDFFETILFNNYKSYRKTFFSHESVITLKPRIIFFIKEYKI